ncbi:unnamed protein product [Camellia sinensis]
MSRTAAPPPPVKAEHNPSPPPPLPSQPPTLIKQELTVPNNPQQPHFINSVYHLRNLSAALSAFHRRYDELHEHLHFIRTSIDSKLLPNSHPSPPIAILPLSKTLSSPVSDTTIAPAIVPIIKTLSSQVPETTTPPAIVPITKTLSSQVPEATTVPAIAPIAETLASDVPEETITAPAIVPIAETLASDVPETTTVAELDKSEQATDNNQSSHSEIELYCKRMCSRSIRRYITSNLSNVSKLREEVPSALKFAENPAKLVLDCFGRFFLQGIKAYCKDSPMIPGRQASVLILEFFLMMGFDGNEIEAKVKEEAESSALDWRKRLISEGGLVKACQIDGRGLLLLIGCFGIPGAFTNDDIKDLVRAGRAREIADVLRRSHVLLARIPEVIERTMKNKREVEAVDITCTFGLESSFSPRTILTSFLQKSKETWKRVKNEAQGSSAAVKEANRKHLADLKLVIKCLENHKIDPLKVLSGWQIYEKISSLEKEIAALDKKIKEQVTQKRKADEAESSKNLKSQELKRTRFAGHMPEQHKAVAYVDLNSSSDRLMPTNLLDSGIPQYGSFSAYSSVLHGQGVGPSPGIGAGVIASRVGAAMSAGSSDLLPTGSYAGINGSILVDRARQVVNHNGQPYGWHGDESFRERLIGQSYAESSALGVNGLYRPAPSMMEGFAGLPNPSSIGVSNRSSNSDLYQFADSIPESDTYGGSRSGGAVRPVVSTHRSSYLY